jgi:hypothetical protein
MITILCHDLIEYYTVKSALLERGLFFVGKSNPSLGKNYLQVDEKSFKQITKKDYENYQQ